MARTPRTSKRTIVGLDVDPGHLAAAEVRLNGGVAIERGASVALAPGILRDGEVTDVDGLAAALKAFFAEHHFGKRVRLGVANQRIVVRTFDLPVIEDPKELDAAVRFQAVEHIPMPLDQAVLDFVSLGVVATPEGERTRVVVVAARRDMLARLTLAAKQAGLRPEGVDLSAFAMVRALDGGGTGEVSVLYINVGGLTNVAVAKDGVCLFTRVVPGGLESMAITLAERRGLTLDHARGWLTHVGLEQALEEVEGDPEIAGEARVVAEDGLRRVADEVRQSLDFYRSQDAAQQVDRAVLTGSAAAIPGFAAGLTAALEIPVQPGLVAEARPGALDGVERDRLSVAAGLAFEERPAA